MKKKYLSVLLVLLGVLIELGNTQKVITENGSGSFEGYNYSLWKDSGNIKMTFLGAGNFLCEWNNNRNAFFLIGKVLDCTKTWEFLGPISVFYSADYLPNGNSYLCVYGRTKNPLSEFYIVENWGTTRPSGSTLIGNINVNGDTYDIFYTTKKRL
jgi:endo-1,4-beta-xylanase